MLGCARKGLVLVPHSRLNALRALAARQRRAMAGNTSAAATAASDAPCRPKVLILTGPTAVGKTKASLALAEALGGEIISADSVQVYRGLDIGSDKVRRRCVCRVLLLLLLLLLSKRSQSMPAPGVRGIAGPRGRPHRQEARRRQPPPPPRAAVCPQISAAERRGIPHHLLDVLDPHQDFSAGDFFVRARAAADDILQVYTC